jgi:ribosomal protein L11 methyltransferase
MGRRHATALETVFVVVPEAALEAYEAALASACTTIGFFLDEDRGLWRVEGVKETGAGEAELATALTLAAAATGLAPELRREPTAAEGWLSRTLEAFPEQRVGRRFAIRGTHLPTARAHGRITLVLDAAVAFGSGEHGSTRGCLRALERVAWRQPARVLDMGTGSGILAMAAASLLRRPVLATDIDPWAVRTAVANTRRNGIGRAVTCITANGWRHRALRRHAGQDLIFANILARPLCLMAREMALHLRPGATAILAGLLASQSRWVLAAYRRQGLRLEFALQEGPWTTLVLRAPNESGRS